MYSSVFSTLKPPATTKTANLKCFKNLRISWHVYKHWLFLFHDFNSPKTIAYLQVIFRHKLSYFFEIIFLNYFKTKPFYRFVVFIWLSNTTSCFDSNNSKVILGENNSIFRVLLHKSNSEGVAKKIMEFYWQMDQSQNYN